MEIFNYFVFVILPVFGLGFQALLLPILFFLKSRNWLRSYSFAASGAIAGIGFGYLFAGLGGAQQYATHVALAVSGFGALSGLFWWYLLVKRFEGETDHS
jgi:hypothetical protein